LSGQALFHLGLAVVAAALCYVGYALRRRQRAARWTTVVVCAALVALPLAVPAPLLVIGGVVGLIVFCLTILSWGELSGDLSKPPGQNATGLNA
jgi:hypothetical protein